MQILDELSVPRDATVEEAFSVFSHRLLPEDTAIEDRFDSKSDEPLSDAHWNHLYDALVGRKTEAGILVLAQFLEHCSTAELPYNAVETLHKMNSNIIPFARIHRSHQIRLARAIAGVFDATRSPELLAAIIGSVCWSLHARQDPKSVKTSLDPAWVPWLDDLIAAQKIKASLRRYEGMLSAVVAEEDYASDSPADVEADDAAKKRRNKEKAQRAAANKSKRNENNAQADALRDATNVSQAVESSPEEQIASLKARLKSFEVQNNLLSRKNKKLARTVRRQTVPNDDNSEIIPIPKPKGKFNIQEAMGLADDQREFTKLQAGVNVLAVEAKIDFDEPWSRQEPSTVAKLLRVSEQRFPYLTSKRFPRYWATSAMLQRYINSVRGYQSGLKNPDSGVSRRRQRVTKIIVQDFDALASLLPPNQTMAIKVLNVDNDGPRQSSQDSDDEGKPSQGADSLDDDDDDDELPVAVD
ncbi:hypothetical protein B0H14DRAFT_3458479 [Mycena olivaceomarginata]|nr:hypothetical protein B0H14DRAFT_3458479 [Mycena olivaceomarginata]